MNYTYEFLRKCHGLRFRATLSNKREEGIIKVGEDGITLCYGAKDPGRMFIFERSKTLSFTEQSFGILPNDFEIVPRDPETYQDWQAGDVICGSLGNYEIIFRSGEVVAFKYTDNKASNIFTCRGLFMRGYRLVLTDIEKQIIEGRKDYRPQDGDIIAWASTIYPEECAISIYKDHECSYASLFITGICHLFPDSLDIKFIRPATDEERQKLFDAMAKEGKRWNAEKKVVEDIKPEDDEAADVQKMISDALKGYIPKGDLEGFPVEVIAKMLERQYEQTGAVYVSVFEKDKIAFAYQSGFDWDKTVEGNDFWEKVIMLPAFSEFFKMYPKAEAPGAGIPSFKRFDPVLVRDKDNDIWSPRMFLKNEDNKFYVLSLTGSCVYYNQCIPLNEDTEKLIGKTEQYYE